ncbi:tetratricopeptide repeat protein [Vibrio fluvialis]|uniref:tetratricopeptide repeat protein n=1 Tax=Vibrio fluvialis TaxID=676 RepID=UPI001EEBE4CE|nr:tetratricopeptide repeat protein [Vibrio fluvialis]MCG6351340.1 tetratricopeptide repeat protein [Vibrio fluvialis]
MTRDNFLRSTTNTLRDRVNNFCSNPKCRVSTRSSHSSKNKSLGTGIAAHIHAASKNGPRYDETMTSEQRKDIGNAIWLCCNCATEIDKDEKKFPASLLHEWKIEAEKRVSENHGVAFLTQEEAEREFQKKLLERKAEFELMLKNAYSLSPVENAEYQDIVEKLKDVTESYNKELILRKEIEETLLVFRSRLPEEMFKKAQDMLSIGNTDSAEEILSSFINENEKNLVMAYIGCGKIAENNFDYHKALNNYKKAAMVSDDQPTITSHACQLAYRIGEYELSLSLISNGLNATGDDIIGKVIFLNQLGLVQRAQGLLKVSIITFKDILNELTSKGLTEHWVFDTVSNNLALAYVSNGNYIEAEKIYNELVVKDTEKFGRKSEQVCISLSSLGTIYEKKLQKDKARKYYEEAHNISMELYDPNHPNAVTNLSNLALINMDSHPKESARIFKDILKNRIEQFGENHSLSIITLGNLASCYGRQKKHLKAKKTLLRALNAATVSLGDKHPETLRVKHNLALSMYDLNEEKDAISLMKEVVADREVILGSDSPITKISQNALSEMDGTKTINMFKAILNGMNSIR